jgi:GAF domain-containing protein
MIADTQRDFRWLALPEEPYQARSALAVPIVKQNHLFGIVILMHPLAHHFNREAVEIVKIAADHMDFYLPPGTGLPLKSAGTFIRFSSCRKTRLGW